MTIDTSYAVLLQTILDKGDWQQDRTSIGESKQLFGQTISFDTNGESAPFIQCRTFAPRIAFEEWKWMMSGSTDVAQLQNKNIHIWDGNSTREFLDARGLQHVPENNIGKAYGYQYRNFSGIKDQITDLVHNLKTDPTSRRHVVSIWNPAESNEMALTPCFHLYEFMSTGDTLNLYVHGRSSDVLFGLPYNFAWSYFFLLAMAKVSGHKTGKILFTLTNAHVYKNQVDLVKSVIKFEDEQPFFGEPKCLINKDLNTLDDILSLEWSDIAIKQWTRGPSLTDTPVEMAV